MEQPAAVRTAHEYPVLLEMCRQASHPSALSPSLGTGAIPGELRQLTTLTHLDLHGNQLTGELVGESLARTSDNGRELTWDYFFFFRESPSLAKCDVLHHLQGQRCRLTFGILRRAHGVTYKSENLSLSPSTSLFPYCLPTWIIRVSIKSRRTSIPNPISKHCLTCPCSGWTECANI